jgi:outer membrane lipoprotein SlyB
VERVYAGILGSAAFTIAILRGWFLGGDAGNTLGQASLALLLFAVLGAVAGRIAFSLVEEGVTSKLRDELASKTKK